ncbi:hypothetical protein DM02DRAFT_602326 [Periconia macrospinosa]|uniref:Uncharacterized protein n=1 Tax=Periconia macrospinosa TaxID=97972 RepID=A0A2V1D8Z3_9PLEO|nr:hypothetical protein DM02DRAFT_602326 [Periconia macrospinosa]
MSPAPITQEAVPGPSPLHPAQLPKSPPQQSGPSMSQQNGPSPDFDDIFHRKFMEIINDFKNNPTAGQLTQKERKEFIHNAYTYTDQTVFGSGRQLDDRDIKLRALTKVFYKVLAEEPWSEEWIRPHDVERKLSRFEMHKDSVPLATQLNLHSPREAIKAARVAQQKAKDLPNDKSNLRGPYDDLEVIFIPGTVSSTATNRINRDTIYPVAVSSVANVLLSHICRDMTRPYLMAQKFVECNDTEELIKMRMFACDVCDFAPHLLDNDNVSLLIILLILSRSEICRRFEDNGIRIEGSTVSHRRAECMKNKLGWKTSEERKPFDTVATELQTRVKNACSPGPRIPRVNVRKRKSSTPNTPGTPIMPNGPGGPMVPNGANGAMAPPNGYDGPKPPQIGLFAAPQVRPPPVYNGFQPVNGHHHYANSNINVSTPPRPSNGNQAPLSGKAAGKRPVPNDEDAMDTS